MNFVNILRKPDRISVADEQTSFRFEEGGESQSKAKVEYLVGEKSAKVVIFPYTIPVKYVKLRWNEPVGTVDKMMGDQWERSGGIVGMEWTGIIPHKRMPWYFHCVRGDKNALYGVKTGPNAFCYWQMDTKGITLFIDLTCGDGGTLIKEALTLCETVSYYSDGEDAYIAAKKFCKLMCDEPVLPKTPIFGVNNWYWAYGRISHESVMRETDYLLKMTDGAKAKPFMILDDGWQINRTFADVIYNGGPWENNDKFPSMQETAQAIREKGAIPGIWFRPLLTMGSVPYEAVIKKACPTAEAELDPTHPYTLERVESDARRIRDWGFGLIKHDFSTYDITGYSPMGMNELSFCRPGVKLFDNTKTTAMCIKEYYRAVQRGAGDAEVIGCNTVGHLVAGIHSAQRVGNDTSGRSFEWTRRYGVNCMMRLPQNDTFFNVDPDCAPFTENVPLSKSLDFLEICAITGMTTLASVTPGILSGSEMKRINGIYRTAADNKLRYNIAGYTDTSCPEKFVSPDGKDSKEYDWYDYYGGARNA